MRELDVVFANDGPLAQAVKNYWRRESQIEMAREVSAAIAHGDVLVAEAGTGTGKTFAYLVPALLSGARVIVSTGSKTLQDQLFHRDIPTLKQALHVSCSIALLKGRANYVCRYRLQRTLENGIDRSLRLISRFAAVSGSGDRAELAGVAEDAAVWPLVTSTRENCLGSECPEFARCFVMEARKRAMSADVVVVNHHLFFSDVWLRDEGFAELLPACHAVIFDEAHELPEIARLIFGERTSTGQLLELARDSRAEAAIGAADFAPLPTASSALEKAVRDLRLTLPQTGRFTPDVLESSQKFQSAISEVEGRLAQLKSLLESQGERSLGLYHCGERAQRLKENISRWRRNDSEESVRWAEVFEHGLQLNSAPLSIAPVFVEHMSAHLRSWIFTSATLSVNGDFGHYLHEMGIRDAQTARWESPYDYREQALLYVPPGLPDPNDGSFTAAAVSAMLPVLQASRGRAFLLFTSLRALNEARDLLREAFARSGMAYPILTQGESPRSQLLERFRNLKHAVLLGSLSFWQGVDIRGPDLSLVVIDKLPFASPDDPVLAGRIAQLQRMGRSAFNEIQLPRAALLLKQGAGRLIRDENDRGVLMICDPRFVAKSYGRRLKDSLPPMPQTRELPEVLEFLAAIDSAAV